MNKRDELQATIRRELAAALGKYEGRAYDPVTAEAIASEARAVLSRFQGGPGYRVEATGPIQGGRFEIKIRAV